MAKKKRKPGIAPFTKYINSIPTEIDFEITMAGDSSGAVYADIDTNLKDGQALAIYGVQYHFETIATPGTPIIPLQSGNIAYQFQLQRGDDNTTPISGKEDEVILNDIWIHQLHVDGVSVIEFPRVIRKKSVTMRSVLRALFVTSTDDTTLSGAGTVELVGKLFCDVMPAPSTASKVGNVGKL